MFTGGSLVQHSDNTTCCFARSTCRERAKMLMKSGAPASAKDDPTLPLNAQMRQSTLGVTSEGFQASKQGAQRSVGMAIAAAWRVLLC